MVDVDGSSLLVDSQPVGWLGEGRRPPGVCIRKMTGELSQWLCHDDSIVTHACCIAAGVGRAFSRVCLFVRDLKGKRLELSTPNLVHIYPIVVARLALTQRSKGQGHTVTKTVTFARLLSDA